MSNPMNKRRRESLPRLFRLWAGHVFAAACLVLAAVATPGLAQLKADSGTNRTGLWWNPAESGWGINFSHQGSILFATLFSYDAGGAPLWLVMPSGNLQADGATFAGELFRTTGSPFDAASFTPIGPADIETVGTMSVAFSGADRAVLRYVVNGVAVTRTIQPQVFGTQAAACAPATGSRATLTNYQDLWWNPAESGWGLNIVHQDDTLFATLFTYDAAGRGLWLVMPSGSRQTADGAYAGDLYRTTGAAFDAQPFPPNAADAAKRVGSLRLRFADGENATLDYTVDGKAVTKAITRQVFANPVTACASRGIPGDPGARFTLTSAAGVEGGTLPADYTCDGPGSSVPLAWSNVPAGTKEFALLMTTVPADGATKWNWVVSGIPGAITGLARDSFGIGTAGVGSDGPQAAYQPPCSQGPGTKQYTFTLHALSAAPALAVPAEQVTGAALAAAIAPVTLGTASLTLGYARSAAPGSSTECTLVRNSTSASTTGRASVSCDATYAYVGSDGLPTHAMMNGITATNLQVPVAQNFRGSNAWRIPLHPAIAATTTTAVDGPIGIAVNGVPIFNPCKQGGCQNGDTKVLGELDVCNGHAGRADDYHYHAAPVCLMAGKPAGYWDTRPVGWALDGFAIFGYNNADGTPAERDAVCGGNTRPVVNAPQGYSYHVTDASPYVLSCFRGTPSPDLAGQAAKFRPLRQPPVTPFRVSGMTLSTDASDGFQVLQFSSAQSFTTTETGSDSYVNAPGSYRIRYRQVSGEALATLLAQARNSGKSACWEFQFQNAAGAATQPATTYCR